MAGNQPVDWSELTPDALLAHMAGLTILKKSRQGFGRGETPVPANP